MLYLDNVHNGLVEDVRRTGNTALEVGVGNAVEAAEDGVGMGVDGVNEMNDVNMDTNVVGFNEHYFFN